MIIIIGSLSYPLYPLNSGEACLQWRPYLLIYFNTNQAHYDVLLAHASHQAQVNRSTITTPFNTCVKLFKVALV